MTIAVLAEKPAVARDLAEVLGARRRGAGCLHGAGYIVTWAVGHLVTLPEPHEIDPAWRRWRRQSLPMLPESWPLVVTDKTRDQFTVIREIINDPAVERIVCATDAGREGELIFRYIYEAAECRKPFSRLWISSLTADAIRQGFRALRDGREFDHLAAAARGRSQADWLVGMNLSRACTLAFGGAGGDVLSVGRVQTPTLAMVVERELAIRAFTPEDYREVVALFNPVLTDAPEPSGETAAYPGTWFRGEQPTAAAKRLPADGVEAEAIIARARAGQARIETLRGETRRQPPPLLYDLTELQRHANRLYGFSAETTLNLAQRLYEQHKAISYPRTDSRHLSETVAATLGVVVEAVAAPYQDRLAAGTGQRPLGRRFVDDGKVTDHHAIIPTPVAARGLGADERKIYEMICRRLLAAWHDDHIASVTTVITAISAGVDDEVIIDRYHATGTIIEQIGWKILEPDGDPAAKTGARRTRDGADAADASPPLPANLRQDQPQRVMDAKMLSKRTRPPPRLTDATLLGAMETAGKTLDDEELAAALKETGLGTPATRAEIIETLLRRGYLERRGKALHATEKGIRLIEVVQPLVKSPAMTGEWEAYLKRVQRGEADLAGFMAGIRRYVREAVEQTLAASATSTAEWPEPGALAAANPAPAPPVTERAPVGVDGLGELLGGAFRLASFRPYQEIVCQAVVQGRDVLLVMPTGAGKSLCYQLPGLARAGTTLVISPLIALMEDQVAKLKELGLRAERIHSGRDRLDSRQVCVAYLNGALDYLFIAPERLSVPGFPTLLAKRKPVLVAVDEAHCISHWGHDFRPDYRMLGQYLPLLRPAPVIALTATATPRVQDDIVAQLGMTDAARFIHGFRRTNIAVEAVELKPGDRFEAVQRVLREARRRPAIVYAPTRKEADALSLALQPDFPAAAYHAGMTAAGRERVQSGFLAGQLEVIVATIAFGMGVDKADIRTVIHTALPSSLESYYQEIGRAGRDGQPARAILLYSYADRRAHDFFHRRDYPDSDVLERIFAALNGDWQPQETVRDWLGMEPELFATALEKLWVHGGARLDPEENVSRGDAAWRRTYEAQREHKLAQLEKTTRFAQAHDCRMLHLVRHFGDQEDSGEPCGLCDGCAPRDCVVRQFRLATATETRAALNLLERLRQRDGLTPNQLRQQLGPPEWERAAFENLLGGLAGAGLVRLYADTFTKDGRVVEYWRVFLTAAGRREGAEAISRVRLTAPAATTPSTAAVQPAGRAAKRPREANPGLVTALKAWRLAEARKRDMPAFRILTDRTLAALAAARPSDEEALLAVAGVGPSLVNKYGRQILAVIERETAI